MSKIERQLNCNGCVACCQNENITITEKQASEYETEVLEDGRIVLAHQDNGNCVYLTQDGCSIYQRRPDKCRAFSCVWLVRTVGLEEARKHASEEILRQAIYRLRDENRQKNIQRKNMLYKKPPRKGKVIKPNNRKGK